MKRGPEERKDDIVYYPKGHDAFTYFMTSKVTVTFMAGLI